LTERKVWWITVIFFHPNNAKIRASVKSKIFAGGDTPGPQLKGEGEGKGGRGGNRPASLSDWG